MKRVGEYYGVPIYESSDVPDGVIYVIDDRSFRLRIKRKKNGDPDMRYAINRLYFRVLGHNDKDPKYFTQLGDKEE